MKFLVNFKASSFACKGLSRRHGLSQATAWSQLTRPGLEPEIDVPACCTTFKSLGMSRGPIVLAWVWDAYSPPTRALLGSFKFGTNGASVMSQPHMKEVHGQRPNSHAPLSPQNLCDFVFAASRLILGRRNS